MVFGLVDKLTNLIDYKKIDLLTLFFFFSLSAIGLISVASASVAFADSLSGNPLYLFNKQLVNLFLGLIILLCVVSIPMLFWEKIDK